MVEKSPNMLNSAYFKIKISKILKTIFVKTAYGNFILTTVELISNFSGGHPISGSCFFGPSEYLQIFDFCIC